MDTKSTRGKLIGELTEKLAAAKAKLRAAILAEKYEAAERFLRKSGGKKRGEEPAALRNRLANYLARQGYGWDTIRPVLRKALDIRTDENEQSDL